MPSLSIHSLLMSVFFVSFSSLAFEVLLTRVFSLGQWNHLSFMVISMALFGFGAGGTFLSIVDIRKKAWLHWLGTLQGLTILLYLYASSTILSFLALNHIPLDYFRLPVEPIQMVYLLAAYLLPALPFFYAGVIISIAYITAPQKTGLVYWASMAGSALGALLPIPLLPLAGEGKLIILAASISLVPAVYSMVYRGDKNADHPGYPGHWRYSGAGGLVAFIVLVLIMAHANEGRLIQVAPSRYKALSQLLQFPETHIVETATSIRGRFDRIKTPYLRYAPGLSLKYSAALPGQNAVFRDGDNQLALYEINRNPGDTRFAKHLLSYAAYDLRPRPARVLLMVSDGGVSIPSAHASGAGQIILVEQSPQIAAILNRQYRRKVITRSPRAFLARDGSRYDIIHLENWGTSLPGSGALDQAHSYTIEAMAGYLKHLKPGGLFTVSRKLLLPPSDSLRIWATAYEALKKTGTGDPAQHLAMLRNFDTFTLIVSNSKIDNERLAQFCEDKNFDLVFLEGMQREMANRFNRFDQPYHYEATRQLAGMYRTGRQDDFFRRYLLDVAPQTDMRPFPGRFLKWSKVKALYRSMGSRFYALFMSGEIVVSVVLLQALCIALILLILPLFVSTRAIQRPKFSRSTYFFAVGSGFMLAEIYFIKRMIILVGDPVISFSVVIAGILVFTGLGGIWVQTKSRPNPRLVLAILIPVLALEVAAFELLLPWMLKCTSPVRFIISILFLMPAGFLMGMPFPIGMQFFLDSPIQRAYAWSVNGCASVLSAIVAAQIAISWGIPVVAAGGGFFYLAAFFLAGGKNGIDGWGGR